MKEQHDGLEPENIDNLFQGSATVIPDERTTRLIQVLRASSQDYVRVNERSLERIWARIIQSQEYADFQHAGEASIQKQDTKIREYKEMEDISISEDISSLVQKMPGKRRGWKRTVVVGFVVVLAAVVILGFSLFAIVQIPAQSTGLANNTQLTPTCSFSTSATSVPGYVTSGSSSTSAMSVPGYVTTGSSSSLLDNTFPLNVNPALAWSKQGQIILGGYPRLQAFAANSCQVAWSTSLQLVDGAIWSPDGSMVALTDAHDSTIYILDNHGKTIAHLTNTQLGGVVGLDLVRWSADDHALLYTGEDINKRLPLKRIDISSGVSTTILQPQTYSNVDLIAPDDTSALVGTGAPFAQKRGAEIWNINTGKKMFTLPFDPKPTDVYTYAFSPDSSQLVIAMGGKMLVYSTANGHLLKSFSSALTDPGVIVWSPDGKYIAQGTRSVTVYSVSTGKVVMGPFGQVDAQHTVIALSWSPDSKGLAGAIVQGSAGTAHKTINVSVWSLR